MGVTTKPTTMRAPQWDRAVGALHAVRLAPGDFEITHSSRGSSVYGGSYTDFFLCLCS